MEPTSPPRVTYALTPTGQEVAGQLQGLLAWVESRAEEIVRFGGGGDGGI